MSYNSIVRALALLFLLALPAAAQQIDGVDVDHEVWKVLGWNDACGVAFEHFYYPVLGQAIASEPIGAHVGEAHIPPGSERYTARWVYSAEGATSWSAKDVVAAEKSLLKAGYNRRGFPELILDAPVGDQPGLEEELHSTTTLAARVTKGWPPSEWRWTGGSYNPLGTCALLSYEKKDAPRHYRLMLVRVYNSAVLHDRGFAHASNARLLFNEGNLDVAVQEADIAAALAPGLPVARYEHAAMMALTGKINEAADELAEAIKLNPKYAARAKDDIDFIDLRARDDFKDMTK
jgi:tetratricopeptide (TPR) repeat protein